MNNNLEAVEQAMTEKEKIALNFFYDYMEQSPPEFESPALDGYYKEICDLCENHATEFDIDIKVDKLMYDAKMVGFVSGYIYAIERLKETLLIR